MALLVISQIARLRTMLAGGASLRDASPEAIGGGILADGFWRLFSSDLPSCGVVGWNAEWCKAWGVPPENAFAFGEDAFGNQLLRTSKASTVYICDHENGSCYDLELDVPDLLEAVLQSGLSWIDFYANGSTEIARAFLPRLSWEQHLHWTQPLILGGAISRDNVSVVERFAHLRGHAELWCQLQGAAPGTEIRI